jgi:Protein of unknown function (DUF3703)
MNTQLTDDETAPYKLEMQQGQTLAAQERWTVSYRHFAAAHDLGHRYRSEHLAAHRAALGAALRSGRPDRAVYQLTFLGIASLTARGDRSATRGHR